MNFIWSRKGVGAVVALNHHGCLCGTELQTVDDLPSLIQSIQESGAVSVTAAEAFGDVESVKAVSDLICPVTGKVAAINEELLDSPELLNSDPYGAWIIKVEGITDKEELLDAAAYEEFCAQEG